LAGARERRLLAILAVATGEVVSKDAIIERLWDVQPRNPTAAVDTAVSLLRRGLGPLAEVIETRRPGYRLACATDWADLDGFLITRRWEDALGVLDGEFMTGEPSSEWVDERRRDVDRRRLDVSLEAARVAASRGDDALAFERYMATATADPLREDAHRGVMTSLARLGRTAESLRAYEHCRRALREELGVDPAPETSAVYEQIVGGRPPPPDGATRAAADAVPFLGRRSELARLAVPSDGCRVRVVLGEPGIGKSRLLEMVTAGLPTDQAVKATKCFRLVSPITYAVLDDLAPELLDHDGPEVSGLGAEATATELAARWAAALDAGSTTLVIDDLQWADEPSIAVLGLVIRRRPRGVTVLLAARDAELAPESPGAQLLELAETLGLLDSVTLGPLSADELLGGGYTFEDWERTGGHPLLFGEWLRGGGDADLASLVLGRAAAAGADATELLRGAAVLDRPAPLADLAELAELPVGPAWTAADRLTAAGLLAESRGLWRVRHDVIAELVRDELAPAARKPWHARALSQLESRSADPAELAHHAVAAEDWQASLRHSLAAGNRAAEAFANREAVTHYDRVLRTLDAHGPGALDPESTRRDAVLGAARALIVLARIDEARHVLDELPRGTGRMEAERLLVEADCAWADWKPSRALRPATDALAIACGLGDDTLEGRVHAFLANPFGSLGELDRATEHIDAALVIADRLDRPPPAVVVYRLSLIEHQNGHEREALVKLDWCRDLAMAQHDERTLVFERVVRAWTLGALGRYGEALAALDDVRSIGRGEEAVVRGRVPNTRASLFFDLGLVEMALDADEESLDITRSHGGAAVAEPQIHTLLNLATDHLHLGDPDRAASCVAEAEELSIDAEYARFRYLNRLHWVRGLIDLEGGDIDRALEGAAAVADMAARYRAPKYDVRARILRGMAMSRRPRQVDAALTELQAATRGAEHHGFAALAERAHRLAADLTGSAHHARRADHWRARMVSSVDAPLRRRLA
jgi:DNA-binding SARP family transcriptional activator/tetratricopeptide (TPR) repeat protein